MKINFAIPNKCRTFAAININNMETQVAYTTPLKPVVTRTRKVAKSARPIPEGYVSAEEFNRVFEQKIRATQQVQATPKERLHTVEEFIDKLEQAVLEKL